MATVRRRLAATEDLQKRETARRTPQDDEVRRLAIASNKIIATIVTGVATPGSACLLLFVPRAASPPVAKGQTMSDVEKFSRSLWKKHVRAEFDLDVG